MTITSVEQFYEEVAKQRPQTQGTSDYQDVSVGELKDQVYEYAREVRKKKGLPVGRKDRVEPTKGGQIVRDTTRFMIKPVASGYSLASIGSGEGDQKYMPTDYFGDVPRVGAYRKKDGDREDYGAFESGFAKAGLALMPEEVERLQREDPEKLQEIASQKPFGKESLKGFGASVGTGVEAASYVPMASAVGAGARTVSSALGRQAAKYTPGALKNASSLKKALTPSSASIRAGLKGTAKDAVEGGAGTGMYVLGQQMQEDEYDAREIAKAMVYGSAFGGGLSLAGRGAGTAIGSGINMARNTFESLIPRRTIQALEKTGQAKQARDFATNYPASRINKYVVEKNKNTHDSIQEIARDLSKKEGREVTSEDVIKRLWDNELGIGGTPKFLGDKLDTNHLVQAYKNTRKEAEDVFKRDVLDTRYSGKKVSKQAIGEDAHSALNRTDNLVDKQKTRNELNNMLKSLKEGSDDLTLSELHTQRGIILSKKTGDIHRDAALDILEDSMRYIEKQNLSTKDAGLLDNLLQSQSKLHDLEKIADTLNGVKMPTPELVKALGGVGALMLAGTLGVGTIAGQFSIQGGMLAIAGIFALLGRNFMSKQFRKKILPEGVTDYIKYSINRSKRESPEAFQAFKNEFRDDQGVKQFLNEMEQDANKFSEENLSQRQREMYQDIDLEIAESAEDVMGELQANIPQRVQPGGTGPSLRDMSQASQPPVNPRRESALRRMANPQGTSDPVPINLPGRQEPSNLPATVPGQESRQAIQLPGRGEMNNLRDYLR